MTVYITKYALTQGVEKIEAEERMEGLIRDNAQHQSYYHGEGREWHRTYESALARAIEVKAKKVSAMQKQLEKLRNLKFTQP